jgi:hypothetical protein
LDTAVASILTDLARVEAQRAARAAAPDWAARVIALKEYQQSRFRRSYADLLVSARYAAAARFFLDELYGPRDFSQRDSQFARVVPTLVRLFPREIVATVGMLARLHAISEELDSTMAQHLRATTLNAAGYLSAWRATGRPPDREQQIVLTLAVGAELDRLTRKPLLRQTLRWMRTPAHAAGLGALQEFLELGFDTFRAMKGADDFLRRIGDNERRLAAVLFGTVDDEAVLGQLP